MITSLMGHLVSQIIFSISCIPFSLLSIYAETRLVGICRKADMIKHMEFILRSYSQFIRNACTSQIFLRMLGNIPRILIKSMVFRQSDNINISYHCQGRYLHKRIHISRCNIRYKHHITLFHRCKTIIAAIETDSVSQNILVESLCRYGQMSPSSIKIHHHEIYHSDSVVSDKTLHIFK